MNFRYGLVHAALASLLFLTATVARAETFAIHIGDTVSDGIPGPGAGRIEERTATDLYTFTATAGQLVFFEELSVANTFQGHLIWEVKSPTGKRVFSAYFDGTNPGRQVLPETGTYTITFSVTGTNPENTGTYSFQLRPIPPDTTFPIQIGDTISDGVPAAGAGRIEYPGAQDLYTFPGTAGQLVFFEELSVANTFQGHLIWEVNSPTGKRVFSAYFDGTNPGRQVLPETGTYTITFSVTGTNPENTGTYSFQLRPIPPDTTFPIQIGDTISDGVPAAGAGRIEYPGAQDLYTFPGTADQNLFFEEISVDKTFQGHLVWELKSPTGKRVFSAYFDGTNPGRQILPETGTYTLTFYVTIENPNYVGSYSFRIRPNTQDTTFPIQIGDVVSDAVPAAGAGKIEAPGTQDLYTFQGTAGQQVFFEEISVDNTFQGHLVWDLKSPSGKRVFSAYFDGIDPGLQTLPETGTYTLTFSVTGTSVANLGAYSFKTYCAVHAHPDALATAPDTALMVPFGVLLCNDLSEPQDTLEIEPSSAMSAQGGLLSQTATAIVYTPKAGFSGVDSFIYNLHGRFGGTDSTPVTVRVLTGAGQDPAVVSVSKNSPASARACLFRAQTQT
ncbi:MAG TPA: Ig-like domain-containing protein [Candidatus Paceibacterota bacterium]|nr:Ig-like domain-containing protein [Verrucomicrobiota bacterium]HRY52135.1 Ig-like domain-containing protein [Candidatus Paceibacterota bacterium]HSA01168.1 Ig-like domain-containing protein [Candidatus Paceibacterota bacterium]